MSPALARVRRAHPRVEVSITSSPASAIEAQLVHGAIDVAIVVQGFTHPELAVTKLGTATSGVYCGPRHPLFRVRSPKLDDITAHPFAGPASDPGQPSIDGWPPDVPRTLLLRSSILDGAMEACASGELLAVLPDHVVATLPGGSKLRRLPCAIILPMAVYAIVRVALHGRKTLAEATVAELRAEFLRKDQPVRRD